MRVCLVSKQFNPGGGGSERYAYALANALARRGHDVDVFTLVKSSGLDVGPLHDRVTVTTLAKRRRSLVTFETIWYSLLARRTIDFDEYDIVHGTLMPASPVALSLTSSDPPLVVTSHGTSLGEVRSHKLELPTDYLKTFFFHPMNVMMDIVTAPRAVRVIAISSEVGQELARYYPVSEETIVELSHGVDAKRFSPDVPPHTAVDSNRFTLLHVGRLVSRKHVGLALEGLAATGRDDVELLIAGTGRHRRRLQARAAELGVADRTTFLGFVPDKDLPSLYASSDAFLFLSRYEGFGLTFLEAMASGTPVIGTAVGGFPDVVADQDAGIVVDRDSSAVGNAIVHLIDSPTRVAKMSVRARTIAEQRTWDTVAAETEMVYSDAVSR